MKAFVSCLYQLSLCFDDNEKSRTICEYFNSASEDDRKWALYILFGRTTRRKITVSDIRKLGCDIANVSDWLFEHCYEIVGDVSEAIALILPKTSALTSFSLSGCMEIIQSMGEMDEEDRIKTVKECWTKLTTEELIFFNKQITGTFRLRIKERIIADAISSHCRIEKYIISHRISHSGNISKLDFVQLVSKNGEDPEIINPYKFNSTPVYRNTEEINDHKEYIAECCWPGLRAQLIFRDKQVFIWSAEEEFITHKCPEFQQLRSALKSSVVLEGMLVPFKEGKHLGKTALFTRINRKAVSKVIIDETPFLFIAYDIIELNNKCVTNLIFSERRKFLENYFDGIGAETNLILSEAFYFNNGTELSALLFSARGGFFSGLILKWKQSVYHCDETDLIKLNLLPLSVKSVLLYAKSALDDEGALCKEYTFGVWDRKELIPLVRVKHGLGVEESEELYNYIHDNTIEKFGPVRSVKPELVFEITYHAVELCTRNKSGIKLKSATISKWHKELEATEADSLEKIKLSVNNYVV